LLSHPLATLLAPFRCAFTRPTWQKVLVLLEGTLLASGRRTVTAALRTMGLQQTNHFNGFHHVLSRARWSPLRLSRLLLVLLVRTFVPQGAPIEIVVDETLERWWGPHITKCAYYHDPVRSSQKHKKISRGFCVAVYDADCDASLDESALGTSFSLPLVDFRGGGYKIGTPT
jgi:DDE superfamily endonuclease